MESPIPSISLSKALTKSFRDLYARKLQWHRHVLSLLVAFHMAAVLGKLYWHYMTERYRCVPPDFSSFVLAVVARITWIFLFRVPDQFLRLKRPGRAYKGAVLGTVGVMLLPNAGLHVWALREAWRDARDVWVGVLNAVVALVLWVVLMVVVCWMVKTYLMGEEDDEFEPVVKGRNPLNRHDGERTESHTDHSARGGASGLDFLAAAYALAVAVTSQNQTVNRTSTSSPNQDPGESSSTQAPSEPSGSSEPMQPQQNALNKMRCSTIARFEYKSQAHAGAHSWWSFPVIPLVLASCATFVFITQALLVREDRCLTKFKAPSLTIKKALYLPLGMYLLSVYALKHRLRASLFETFETPVPEPWKRLIRVIPGVTMFRNLHTGQVTQDDPRQRAMPPGAYKSHTSIDNDAYIKAYNNPSGPCTSYHGHLGREHKTTFRSRPTLVRISYLSLTLYLLFTGVWNTIWYDVLNPYEEMLKHPGLTADDVVGIYRQLWLWQVSVYLTVPLLISAGLYAVMCIFSMVVIWGSTVLKYAEIEKSGENTEGAIRLE